MPLDGGHDRLMVSRNASKYKIAPGSAMQNSPTSSTSEAWAAAARWELIVTALHECGCAGCAGPVFGHAGDLQLRQSDLIFFPAFFGVTELHIM